MPGIPKKLMSALDFEKVDGDRKNTTFIGILPVFVVIGEKTQEIEVELTVAHPELRDKVVEIFTAEPPADPAAKPAVKSATKSAPAAPKRNPLSRDQADCQARAEVRAKAGDQADCQARAEVRIKAGDQAGCQVRAEVRIKARAEAGCQVRAEVRIKARAQADCQVRAEVRIKARAQADCQARAEVRVKTRSQARNETGGEARVKIQTRAEEECEARFQKGGEEPPGGEKIFKRGKRQVAAAFPRVLICPKKRLNRLSLLTTYCLFRLFPAFCPVMRMFQPRSQNPSI